MKDQFDFSNFTLSFFKEINSENLDHSDVFEQMENMIPNEAKFCGSINTFEQGWIEWNHKFEFYIIPDEGKDFDWALFRINWDDNFLKWNWVDDVRLKQKVKMLMKQLEKCLLNYIKNGILI